MTLRTWTGRTVRNWRWWVTAPFVPIFICIVLMYAALDAAQEMIVDIVAWKRAGDRK